MRATFVLLHRWLGLFIAVFLFVSGATGAVISWDHELDEWLNPHLFEAKAEGEPLPPLELVKKVDALDPRGRVTWFNLSYETGRAADVFFEPRVDPKTNQPYELDYNQVFIDPVTGEVLGKRYWGQVSLNSENLLPFLYKLHYTMHIPDAWGIEWGFYFMGVVAIVWTFDCFVGFYLTLPARADGERPRRFPSPRWGGVRGGGSPESRPTVIPPSRTLPHKAGGHPPPRRTWWQRWKPAWQIRWRASGYRLNLDLHRAFGLWLWLMLFIIAFTSISMNLGDVVVRPILSTFSTLSTDAWEARTTTPPNQPIEPAIPFAKAIELAGAQARKLGWTEPAGSIFYGLQHGLYSVSFFEAGDDHGSGGMGVKALTLDGKDGSFRGSSEPWKGTAADIFMQLQFPLHSGRIAGIPGRVLLSFMGVVVAMLSFTGIVIWLKKRAGPAARAAGRPSRAPLPQPLGAAWLRPFREQAWASAVMASTERLRVRALARVREAAAALTSPAARRSRQVALVRARKLGHGAIVAGRRLSTEASVLARLSLRHAQSAARVQGSAAAARLRRDSRRLRHDAYERLAAGLERLASASDRLAANLRERLDARPEPGE